MRATIEVEADGVSNGSELLAHPGESVEAFCQRVARATRALLREAARDAERIRRQRDREQTSASTI